MTEQFKISERSQYDGFKSNGREHPLTDSNFDIEINLRKEIQNELFGDEDNPGNRHKLFLWLWERMPHVCEETGTFLGYSMQAYFMSHILTRGAHIEMWNDPRNINILSPDAHRHWETGKREKMRIWKKNKETIALLKSDYSQLKIYKVFTPVKIDHEELNKEIQFPFPPLKIVCPHCQNEIVINIKS